MTRRSFDVRFLAAILAFALIPAAALAQQQQQKPSSKSYVLKAARMFDGKSNSLTTPGLVVVTDGKITAVGSSASVPAVAPKSLTSATPRCSPGSSMHTPTSP